MISKRSGGAPAARVRGDEPRPREPRSRSGVSPGTGPEDAWAASPTPASSARSIFKSSLEDAPRGARQCHTYDILGYLSTGAFDKFGRPRSPKAGTCNIDIGRLTSLQTRPPGRNCTPHVAGLHSRAKQEGIQGPMTFAGNRSAYALDAN